MSALSDGIRSPHIRSGYVQVGRLRLHHTWGGRGSPVLLIHGLGPAGCVGWRYTLPFVGQRHLCLAPDLPGFGRSEKPKVRYGIPLFTRTMVRYLDLRGINKVAIVGASMGGRIALEMALRHPQRVSRLVLVNTLGLGYPGHLWHGFFLLPRVGETAFRVTTALLGRLPADTLRSVANRLRIVSNADRSLDDDFLQALREAHADQQAGPAYLATVRGLALMGHQDVSSELGRLRMPVRLIWGSHDPLFPLEHATRAHRLLAESRLAVIEGAGHSPEAERPDEFNRALTHFLAE
jgi:pimeloyl-ACP methyl ester carboxylesterase